MIRTAITEDDNISPLFGIAHVCGSRGLQANYIALPPEPQCDLKPRGQKVREQWITLFFDKTFSDPIEAYACEVEITRIVTFTGFWGS